MYVLSTFAELLKAGLPPSISLLLVKEKDLYYCSLPYTVLDIYLISTPDLITMRLIIRDDPPAASAYIAQYIIGSCPTPPTVLCSNTQIDRITAFAPTVDHPFVLGLPTGASPVRVYEVLVRRYKAGDISFEHVVTFNMV